MKIKAGETRYLVRKIETKKSYDNVRFRLTNKKNTIEKSTDAEAVKDKVIVQDGVFLIPLQQKDTADLVGSVTIEAEIDYKDNSVRYTDYNAVYVNESLGWEQVTGSKPSDDDGIEPVMEAIEQGIYVIIGPESSQELINAVTDLFQDTKEIAQSVRDDADAGMFNGEDGQDGYSPQVTVKTETPSTYVLHIKDAEHEFDTPNLQGQGGEGSLEVGDGLKRSGNVVSIDLKSEKSYLEFSDGKLGVGTLNLGISNLRSYLADPNLLSQYSALADRGSVEYATSRLGNSLSVTIDPTTYVMTIYLKHDNTVLASGTVDLPLESVVVSGSYDSQTKEVVLTLQSGSTVRFSVADLVSGLVSTDQLEYALVHKTTETITLENGVKTSAINCNDIALVWYSNKDLVSGEKLYLIPVINNVEQDYVDITDKTYDYVFDYDSIKFLVESSEDRHFELTKENNVTRERKVFRELTALQQGKQDKINNANKLNADYLQDGSTNKPSVWNTVTSKVDKDEITDTVTLVNDTWCNQISAYGFAQVYWGTGVLPSGATLWLQPFISHTPSGDAINVTGNYAYDISEYEQISFKITGVSEDFDFTYTLQNDVVRQREFKEQLGNKQDTIDSTHKLSADNVDDTSTTNKFVPSHSSSDENKVLSVDSQGGLVWVTSSGGHKIIESQNDPPTTSSDYEVGDEWIKGGAEVFKCVAKNGTSLTWGNLSLNNYDDLATQIIGGNA